LRADGAVGSRDWVLGLCMDSLLGTTRKKARVAAPLDEGLDALESATAAIARRHAHSFSEAQATRFVDAMEKLMATRKEVLAYRIQMERERRARPVDEVLLPSDILSAVLCHVAPNDLAASFFVCRHFQMAVRLAIAERGRRLGVLPGIVAKLSAQKLGVLEKHAKVATQHIVALSSRESREALKLLSTDILRVHFLAMASHVENHIGLGSHLPSATHARAQELRDTLNLLDKFKLPPRFLVTFAPERVEKSAVEFDAANFARPCVMKTLLALLTADFPCNKTALDLIARGAEFSETILDAIVAVDVEMLAIKAVLRDAETDSLFMADVLRLLAKLPKRALVPLRADLVQQSRERDEDFNRNKASELLVAMDMEGV